MRKIVLNVFRILFNSKKNLRIAYTLFAIVTIYYSIITGFYLLFLLPLIAMWLMGSEDVKFYDVPSSREVHRTDISYFTTGDIQDSSNIGITCNINFYYGEIGKETIIVQQSGVYIKPNLRKG